ncbi:MAG: plasmid mobilization relaxosome protein MobC [Flavisolibacter sp.]|nr:plasmid mobilization relaxosome protein MobC [Flavisolibacter sp.]MBD0296012.1 plasmid mobilization relaxosome protein MobC [Flavisolibacter sp.]MBD0349528.1 plasmid mobilization relaxosome protein MobC [Flavisolibacter sp.]MBD0374204.1 plasmid mobilization relaxosome protein MobC [Flavisolibacter sp.]
MKTRRESKYTRKVTVRFQQTEYAYLERQLKISTCHKLSDFLRKVLLQEPITMTYRNASADAFLTEMSSLKKELSAIGNNFNQAVKRLHLLRQIPEVKIWLLLHESILENFLKKTEEIRLKTHQIYEQWLLK